MMSEHNGKHDYDGIGTPLELGKEPPTFSDEDLAGIVLGRPDPAICLNWRSRRSGSSGNFSENPRSGKRPMNKTAAKTGNGISQH